MSDLEGFSDLMNSSSSDNDDLDHQVAVPKRKNENYIEETVPNYDDGLFFEHFRMNRHKVRSIAEKYSTSHQYKRHFGQHGKLSALNQVYIFLWFIGHETASFGDVADRFNISISSLHRVIKRLTVFLSNLSPEIITWPTENEKRVIEESSRENGFPGIIGAIDGCHIKIDKPENDPDSYLNRKGYYSIQMQVVCDATRMICDVFVGYPGSVHDSRVLRNSPLGNDLEEKCGRYFILRDSSYPLKKNLLTPFKDRGQLTHRHRNYNAKLSKNRYVVEHCFGILKQKFRQLYHIKLRKMPYIIHLIRAACVLHNISLADAALINENEDEHVHGAIRVPDVEEEIEDDNDIGAREIRDNIADSLLLAI